MAAHSLIMGGNKMVGKDQLGHFRAKRLGLGKAKNFGRSAVKFNKTAFTIDHQNRIKRGVQHRLQSIAGRFVFNGLGSGNAINTRQKEHGKQQKHNQPDCQHRNTRHSFADRKALRIGQFREDANTFQRDVAHINAQLYRVLM